MGIFVYGRSTAEVTFDDRALFHLQIVITAKLRRHESFLFTWTNPLSDGGGRSSIWLHPSNTMMYRFSGSRMPLVNREWINLLMESANSGGGLHFIPEPEAAGHTPSRAAS
ncbi:ATP-dependent DNA ligase [Lacisediminihabitans sp. H27-G8]|uniref:DUF7882 family protein n=1 Tax=Lacisediminihabitans sp. H27-G8 TaxID=3111909 RepID=UPI0038FCBE1B